MQIFSFFSDAAWNHFVWNQPTDWFLSDNWHTDSTPCDGDTVEFADDHSVTTFIEFGQKALHNVVCFS